MGHSIAPALVERHEDAGLPASILAALEREAAHLTRRDGLRRHIVRWGDDPPSIEKEEYAEGSGPTVLATIGIV